jgi:hypothetical protein
MEFHGMDLPTIAALALLSLVLTWAISALLEAKEEKKRERECGKRWTGLCAATGGRPGKIQTREDPV